MSAVSSTMSATRERPTAARTYARAALGVAGRTHRTTFRNPALLTPPIFAPLIFFAIFGGGLGAGRRSAAIVGYAATAVVRIALGLALLFAVGTAVGVRMQGSAWNVVALAGIGLAYGVTVALFAIGMALRVRSMQGAPAMQVPALIALFFAPAFAPLALLTGWIHGAATWNPVSYLLESGRGYVAGDTTDVGRAVLALTVLLPLTVVWTATGLRRAERTV